jgi:hypothetical protein
MHALRWQSAFNGSKVLALSHLIPDALISGNALHCIHGIQTSEGGERGLSQRRSLVTKEREALPTPGLDGVPGYKILPVANRPPQQRSLIRSKPVSIYIRAISLVLVDNLFSNSDQTLCEAL